MPDYPMPEHQALGRPLHGEEWRAFGELFARPGGSALEAHWRLEAARGSRRATEHLGTHRSREGVALLAGVWRG